MSEHPGGDMTVNQAAEPAPRGLRGLFWPILFLCLSINLNLFGGLNIDFLPDVVGYYCIAGVLHEWADCAPVSSRVRVCLWVGALSTLPSWVPNLWSAVPQAGQTAVSVVGMIAQMVVLRQVFALLIAVSRVHGRDDLAENGVRFRRLYTIGGCIICAGILRRGALTGGVYLLQFVFTLSAAAYAANCDRAFFPTQDGEMRS